MSRLRALWSRLLGVAGRRHIDADLDRDIQAHLDLLAAAYAEQGMTPAAARAAARRDFGAVEPMKEIYRDHRGIRWIEDARRDVRYAMRWLEAAALRRSSS